MGNLRKPKPDAPLAIKLVENEAKFGGIVFYARVNEHDGVIGALWSSAFPGARGEELTIARILEASPVREVFQILPPSEFERQAARGTDIAGATNCVRGANETPRPFDTTVFHKFLALSPSSPAANAARRSTRPGRCREKAVACRPSSQAPFPVRHV